jgi:hypothetical protein
MATLGQRELDINQAYEQDVLGARSGVEADYMRQLMDRQAQLEQRDYQQAQLNDQRSYNEQQQVLELARQTATQQQRAEIDTIDRYGRDYSAEIQRRQATPDTADDFLIPYLQQSANQKLGVIEQNKAKAESQRIELENQQKEQQIELENQAYDNAMKMWDKMGQADQNTARILGIPVGTPTSDMLFKQAELKLKQAKERTASTKASTTAKAKEETAKATAVDFATDKDFISLRNTIQELARMNNIAQAQAILKNVEQDVLKAYGKNGKKAIADLKKALEIAFIQRQPREEY